MDVATPFFPPSVLPFFPFPPFLCLSHLSPCTIYDGKFNQSMFTHYKFEGELLSIYSGRKRRRRPSQTFYANNDIIAQATLYPLPSGSKSPCSRTLTPPPMQAKSSHLRGRKPSARALSLTGRPMRRIHNQELA